LTRPWRVGAGQCGGRRAIPATISFLFTTPGIGEESAGGVPLLSMTGQFLVKDVALLGIAV
jgi:uncharacterized membrane protein YkgB